MIKYETDSRKVKKGQVFVAIKGHTVDGHDYIENAITNGAIKIIAEKKVKVEVPVEIVEDSEEYLKEALKKVDVEKTAIELDVGGLTLKDIIEEISKPGRDPRESLPKPILRSDVLKFEDLQIGMILSGTVRNVIDFGAFVDIGVKYDGLVHISEMSNKYIKNPSDIVSVGDIVKVKVINLDNDRHKVALSMKIEE